MQWPFCNRIQHISTHNILQTSKLIEFRHKQEYTCKWERERERERERDEMRMRKGRQTTCVTFCSLWRYTIYFYWWLKLISVNKCYFHKKKCYLWCNYPISKDTGTFFSYLITRSIGSCNACIKNNSYWTCDLL